jgi:hypothetical protein
MNNFKNFKDLSIKIYSILAGSNYGVCFHLVDVTKLVRFHTPTRKPRAQVEMKIQPYKVIMYLQLSAFTIQILEVVVVVFTEDYSRYFLAITKS